MTVSKILAATGIISIFILSSCEEDPTFLGRNILPSSDDIVTKYNEDISFKTLITEGKPQVTSLGPVLLLGSYTDSNFGFSKADFMTKFAIADASIGEEITVDSMILNLDLSGFYGDSLSVQNLRVYKLREGLPNDTIHYSSILPDGKYDPTELASIQARPTDSLLTLKIVDADLFREFEAVDDSVYADPLDFFEFFQGLYITTDEVVGSGAVMYVNLTSTGRSGLTMYYHKDDTSGIQSSEMIITEYTPRVNTFYHDYEGSKVSHFLNNTTTGDTALFVSAMGGINTRITLPGIEEWINKKPIAINKAELYLPVEDTTLTGLSLTDFPPSLLLQTFDENDNFVFIRDYLIDSNNRDYYGGSYNAVENAYVFNIGLHLQSFIEGKVNNMDLVLRASQNTLSANRVILKGSDPEDTRKMKLKITYTEL